VPDYVDDILRQTAPARQRPRWTFLERWLPMIVPLRTVSRGTSPWRRIALVSVLIVIMLAAAVAIVGSQRRFRSPFGRPRMAAIALTSKATSTRSIQRLASRSRRHRTARDHDPRFSRDGTRIAFLRDTGEQVAIVVADADGREQKVVTPEPFASADVDGIMWSPDGRWIAVNATMPATPRRQVTSVHRGRHPGRVRELAVDYVGIETYWRPPDVAISCFQGERDGLNGLYLVTPPTALWSGLRSLKAQRRTAARLVARWPRGHLPVRRGRVLDRAATRRHARPRSRHGP
jgi:dipeptidyl aminopeptidase/acylaminoacyl peptidase